MDADERAEKLLLDNGLDGAKFLTGYSYDTAIIGFTSNDEVVYDYDKMVEWLIREEDMTEEEAADWISYNTERAVGYMGEGHPIIMYPVIR